jgi:hypothetical protein
LDDDTRLSHLRALIAMQMAGQRQEMTLMSKASQSLFALLIFHDVLLFNIF